MARKSKILTFGRQITAQISSLPDADSLEYAAWAAIKKNLAKIGVFTSDISWDAIGGQALISFEYKGKRIEKTLKTQPDARRNLQALHIWLKDRIKNMERGIESFDQSFSGYLKLGGEIGGPSVNTILTPYQKLGVQPTDDQKTIEREFKRQAFLWHPDKHQNDVVAEERFKEINGAWTEIKKEKGWI